MSLLTVTSRPASCSGAMYAGVPLRTSEPSISPASPASPKSVKQHLPAPVQHDVAGLQVAMQHALLMRRRETGAQFARDLQRFIAGQPADAPQQRAEVFAVDVFHGEHVQTFDLGEVVNAAHVGVGYLARAGFGALCLPDR